MIINVGELVPAGYQGGPMLFTGIITRIVEVSCEETVVHVLCDNTIKYFVLEEDNIEKIEKC